MADPTPEARNVMRQELRGGPLEFRPPRRSCTPPRPGPALHEEEDSDDEAALTAAVGDLASARRRHYARVLLAFYASVGVSISPGRLRRVLDTFHGYEADLFALLRHKYCRPDHAFPQYPEERRVH